MKLGIYIYMYIYVYMYIPMYVHVYAYTYTYTHTHVYIPEHNEAIRKCHHASNRATHDHEPLQSGDWRHVAKTRLECVCVCVCVCVCGSVWMGVWIYAGGD